MSKKHDDSDLTELFRSLDRQMERDRESPFDSRAVFHQLLMVRQWRQRRRHWMVTGGAMFLLLALGAIGFQIHSRAVETPVVKQGGSSTSRTPDGPTLAETLANDPEFLSAQLAILQEHRARLELIALRNQNEMNSSHLVIDPSLIVSLHSKAWRSVEVPDVSDVLSEKFKYPNP